MRALGVVGRKTQISVMGALDRSYPGQVSLKGLPFQLSLFSFTGQLLYKDGP